MEIQVKSRIVWVDVFRGFLILTVILGHSFQRGDYEESLLWNLIYSFHMAAFFTLSGWISYKASLPTAKNIWKRTTSLMIPFVVWSIVGIIVSASPDEYMDELFETILHPDKSYWFLYVLLIVTVLYETLRLISYRLKFREYAVMLTGVMALFVIMTIFELRIFGFQFIAYYIYFYCLGAFLRKYNVTCKLSVTVIIGIAWLIMALYWRMHDVPEPISFLSGRVPSSILCYGYRLVAATLGAIFFLYLFQYLFSKRNSKILSYLGTISLELYIIHSALGGIIAWGIGHFVSMDNLVIFNLIDFMSRTLLSCVIIAFILKLPYVRCVLFGRR